MLQTVSLVILFSRSVTVFCSYEQKLGFYFYQGLNSVLLHSTQIRSTTSLWSSCLITSRKPTKHVLVNYICWHVQVENWLCPCCLWLRNPNHRKRETWDEETKQRFRGRNRGERTKDVIMTWDEKEEAFWHICGSSGRFSVHIIYHSVVTCVDSCNFQWCPWMAAAAPSAWGKCKMRMKLLSIVWFNLNYLWCMNWLHYILYFQNMQLYFSFLMAKCMLPLLWRLQACQIHWNQQIRPGSNPTSGNAGWRLSYNIIGLIHKTQI